MSLVIVKKCYAKGRICNAKKGFILAEAVCINCGVLFEASRSTAKFHDNACKVAYKRTELLQGSVESIETPSTSSPLLASSGKPLTEQEFANMIGIRVDSFLPFQPLQIPENVMTLIYGNKGAGKSTLALGIAKSVNLSGKRVLFIDSEAALSSKRLFDLGINPANFTLKRIQYVEELYDILTADSALSYDLIVVDGLERLGFVTEAENEASSANIGVKARILNKVFRLINVKYYENGVTSIFINHERPEINGMGHYLPGGQGQLNASSHTLRLYTTTKSRFQKNKVVAGQITHCKVEKSRFMRPHQELKLKLWYDTAEIEAIND